MRCMIISQRTTFHARLAVKAPNIYLSFQSQRTSSVLCRTFSLQVYLCARYKSRLTDIQIQPLIYMALSLGPRMCLSHKAPLPPVYHSWRVRCALKQLFKQIHGIKTRLLTSPWPLCRHFSFSSQVSAARTKGWRKQKTLKYITGKRNCSIISSEKELSL